MKTLLRSLVIALLLAAACFAQHQVTLTWTWTQGTGDAATLPFVVQRATVTGGPYAVLPATSSCETVNVSTGSTYTCIDTSVIGGQTYFYVVAAANSAGDSPNSNEAKAAVPVSKPLAPTGLTATAQ